MPLLRLSFFFLALSVACSGSNTAGLDGGADACDAGLDAGSPAWTPAECLADPACPLPMVSAHRGHCGDEPENTLAAMIQCEAVGAPIIEIDTRETADGAIVIMHDADVVRTTDGETRFPGRVNVSELSLAEFSQLVIDDERCETDPDGQAARCHPPTFRQLLENTSWSVFMVDFKAGDATKLAQLVDELGAADRLLFFDSNLDNLGAYRQVLPEGVVMGRASTPGEFQAIIDSHHAALNFRWLHGDPEPMEEVLAVLSPYDIRLYFDVFTTVDVWLAAALSAGDAEQEASYLTQAWQVLDGTLARGASGLGVEFTWYYLDYLYPRGFGY